jgi:enterochelin esterase family protein
VDVAMRLHTVGRLSGDERGPLLVVLDGPDYVRRASLLRLLRRLVDEDRVPAHRVAIVRPEDRLETYSASIPYARSLTEALD